MELLLFKRKRLGKQLRGVVLEQRYHRVCDVPSSQRNGDLVHESVHGQQSVQANFSGNVVELLAVLSSPRLQDRHGRSVIRILLQEQLQQLTIAGLRLVLLNVMLVEHRRAKYHLLVSDVQRRVVEIPDGTAVVFPLEFIQSTSDSLCERVVSLVKIWQLVLSD